MPARLTAGKVAEWLLPVLYQRGFFATRATSPNDIDNLVQQLHPIESEHELIRVGPFQDGGYLIPDDLQGVAYCYSPGVATESGFEVDLAARGIEIFMADASVERPAISHTQFHFSKKFLGAFEDGMHTTLDAWKAETIGDYRGDLLLQMDIEGSEYETLLAASSRLIAQFRIMVIEFHNLHQLMGAAWFGVASSVFRRILTTHAVVHIHPNNCCGFVQAGNIEIPRVAEFTFQRRDRISGTSPARSFPHLLDVDNTANPSLILPPTWYR